MSDPTIVTHPDYAPVIRREVEECVKRLIKELRDAYRYHTRDERPTDPIEPQYILMGDLVGLHRGYSVFDMDESIMGLPVKRDHNARESWDISVCADKVAFKSYVEEWDDDEEHYEQKVVFSARDVIKTERFC